MPRNGIFISYSRKDGVKLAAQLRDTFEHLGFPVWQDIVQMEGGRDWWQQITDTLDQVEFMVLVATPGSMESHVVRREWRYARQQGVCVYPVYLPQKGPDFDTMPNWMRDKHFYDYSVSTQREKLFNDLNTRCTTPRAPFIVEDLPEDFVNRPAEFEALITQLLDADRDNPVAITAALRGAGGYGKTTLARAICHNEDIQQAFDDGILWVTLGENPGDVISKVKELINVLKPDERVDAISLEVVKSKLKELMLDRDILLVVDDVWKRQDLDPFLNLGSRAGLLVTTRFSDTLPVKVATVNVDEMERDEALDLLTANLNITTEQRHSLLAIAERLGEWPLLLKQVNRQLHVEIEEYHIPFDEALSIISQSLDDYGLTVFDAEVAVAATLESSINRLDQIEQRLYAMLSIFPEDTDVPLVTVSQFWDKPPLEIRHTLQKFHRWSLLLELNLEAQTLRFHDVVRTYLQEQNRENLPAWHHRLLDSHNIEKWANLPEDEPYLWNWLAYHLMKAGRTDELLATVLDGNYLARKTLFHKDKVLAVESDLVVAHNHFSNSRPLELLKRNYANMGHLLSRIENLSDIAITIRNRLQHLEELHELCEKITLSKPYIEAKNVLPDVPHPALIRTVTGHGAWVTACAVSPDGAFIVSASKDGTFRAWDSTTGAEVRSLSGHSRLCVGCAVSPDGSFIVTAAAEKTLKVWDSASGHLLHILTGHSRGMRDCAVSPDGTFIVSASNDGTLKVWDSTTGVERYSLVGHSEPVFGCAVSPDSSYIVSCSRDKTLKVWDSASGRALQNLHGHTHPVFGCAVSPDSTIIVSASSDKTLKVWDSASGQVLNTLTGHVGGVRGCAVSPDGTFIVSASTDQTLKVWDSASGRVLNTLTGHVGGVEACTFSPDGAFIISASIDKTLKIWESTTGQIVHTQIGHMREVRACEVSSSGALVISASIDKNLKIWDSASGQFLHNISGYVGELFGGVNGYAVSPDDSFIVTVSSDKTLKVWDSVRGQIIHTLTGHTGPVRGCSISPDGVFVVSASEDQMLIIWDRETGQRVATFQADVPFTCCDWSPDGDTIVAGNSLGGVYFLRFVQ